MPAGQPTKYKKEYAEQALKLCKLGAIDRDLADFFGVTETTINNWKDEHPKFFESIKEGKLEPDQEIENSLFNRAKGMKRTIQRLSKDGDVLDCEEELPPDPVSMIFWLKNRRPDRWRDKQEHEVTGKGGEKLSIVVNVNAKKPNG